MGKWTVKLLCLLLGSLCLIICSANGANLETKANIQKQLDVIIDANSLSFPTVNVGKISEEKNVTVMVKGNDLYQLYIQATVLKADGLKELLPTVLEFKEKSESRWLPASDALIPVLTTPAMAKASGDQKEIAFRLNVPPSAKPGLYSCEVNIIACVYADANKSVNKDIPAGVSEDVHKIDNENDSTSVSEHVYN
ncbi:hypothetical protein L7E55_02880 [Pelotomaculum isophthalicicum JI]|uniref:Uncharacterized protein n=1 Tax=Pelotomaculum isophthalicicum JI TaxID=947010 RepID=A0A9X4GXZ2_9FIRM|nr:hypothetical protein [Pelotomaculum isophthalicicum]MDF9407310.1 hypothetical protein [Pelotomaculum isophthalicicum JI]